MLLKPAAHLRADTVPVSQTWSPHVYSRILVPFDGSETSTRGLDEAIRIASKTGASLRIVHLIDELRYITGFVSYQAYASEVVPFMRSEGAKILLAGRSRAERAGVKVETSLVEGVALHLSDVVIDQVRAWGANLIVIGTHGRRGVSRWMLDSDAEQIARDAPVPILLVRPLGDAAQVCAKASTDSRSEATVV